MKKITAILLIGTATLFFTACGGGSDDIEDRAVDDVIEGSIYVEDLLEELPDGGCPPLYDSKYDSNSDRYYQFVEKDNIDRFLECTYHDNDLLMVTRYCNGEVEQRCQYTDYYSDGTLGEISITVNGELNGFYVEHYPTGEVQIEGEYVDGEKHGTFTVYKAPGVLHAVEEWESGVRVDVEYYNI